MPNHLEQSTQTNSKLNYVLEHNAQIALNKQVTNKTILEG